MAAGGGGRDGEFLGVRCGGGMGTVEKFSPADRDINAIFGGITMRTFRMRIRSFLKAFRQKNKCHLEMYEIEVSDENR